jgi:hypothetical protein
MIFDAECKEKIIVVLYEIEEGYGVGERETIEDLEENLECERRVICGVTCRVICGVASYCDCPSVQKFVVSSAGHIWCRLLCHLWCRLLCHLWCRLL